MKNKFINETYKIMYNKNNESKHIAFACTNNYICYAGIVIISILNKSKDVYTFHIFTDSSTEKDNSALNDIARTNCLNIYIHYVNNNIFVNSGDPGAFSIASYYRMLMPTFMESFTDKFLYLDTDVIACRDISPIWNIHIDKKCALVMDVQGKRHVNEYARIGVERYFCSGVIFINVKEWNKEKISEAALEMSKNNVRYLYPDQDILNILLNKKTIFIDGKYQYQYSIANSIDTISNPTKEKIPEDTVIFHYIGSVKPWDKLGVKFKVAKPFCVAKEKSPWKDLPFLEPKSYKEWHKFARLAKKEGSIPDIVYYYYKYSIAKIKQIVGV